MRSSSPRPKSLKSSITVVSRHEEYDPEKILKKSLSSRSNDEKYDPENILKKSIESKVQVARKPPSKVRRYDRECNYDRDYRDSYSSREENYRSRSDNFHDKYSRDFYHKPRNLDNRDWNEHDQR